MIRFLSVCSIFLAHLSLCGASGCNISTEGLVWAENDPYVSFAPSSSEVERIARDVKSFSSSSSPSSPGTQASVAIIGDAEFSSYFPISEEASFGPGTYAGQIRVHGSPFAVGTGTIFRIEKSDDDKLTATGISAIHSFVGGCIILPLPRREPASFAFTARKGPFVFYQDLRSVVGGTANCLATVDISEVRFNGNPDKDICIFRGEYTPNFTESTLSESEKVDFIERLIHNLPVFLDHNLHKEHFVFMHHYPLSVPEQRKNTGVIHDIEDFASELGSGTHSIHSASGSSGAAIFLQHTDEETIIVGIHLGKGHYPQENAIRYVSEMMGDESLIAVTRYNAFDYVTKKEVERIIAEGVLLQGASLKLLLGRFPFDRRWLGLHPHEYAP